MCNLGVPKRVILRNPCAPNGATTINEFHLESKGERERKETQDEFLMVFSQIIHLFFTTTNPEKLSHTIPSFKVGRVVIE